MRIFANNIGLYVISSVWPQKKHNSCFVYILGKTSLKMPGCCVPKCKSNSKEKAIQLHRFPSDLRKRIQWANQIKRPHWFPNEHSRICTVCYLKMPLSCLLSSSLFCQDFFLSLKTFKFCFARPYDGKSLYFRTTLNLINTSWLVTKEG